MGPVLFLLHINDLPSVITSQIRLLMIASYTAPSALVQTEALQRDLDSPERWSSAWGMKFNTKIVKLCPSPVESHILPICITYVVTYIVQCPDSQVSWDHSYGYMTLPGPSVPGPPL